MRPGIRCPRQESELPTSRQLVGEANSVLPAQAKLAEAMRLLLPLTRVGYHRRTEDLARDLDISPSTFYRAFEGYLSTRTLRLLYAAAERGSAGQPMPVSREVLEDLRQRGVDERRASRAASVLAAITAPLDGEAPADNNQGPGSDPVDSPVPPNDGDRQPSQTPGWVGMDALEVRRSRGNTADILGILRHSGFGSTPAEAVAAIASCYRKGFLAEAETILSYASRRSEMDIIEIARDLLDAECLEGARTILGLRLSR